MISRLKTIISKLQGYFWTFGILWLLGLMGLMNWGYEESFLILNAQHHPILDWIAPHFTHIGDGVLVGGLFALLVVRNNKALVICLSITLLTILLFTTFSKEIIFSDWDRPVIVFHNGPPIHYITLEGERWKSFPSGHSTVSAAIFLIITFSHKSNNRFIWGLFWGLVASFACYTRLYIGVHFLGDIITGSALGVLISISVLMVFYDRLYVYFATLNSDKDKKWFYGLFAIFSILWLVNTARLSLMYLP